GYWNRPDATAETLKDGWLYTGDIVHMDEDGYTFIVDRKKDMLKYKGYQYSSREIEEVLFEHPAIQQAAVIGVKTDMGEIPKAFIVLKEGAKLTPEEISEFTKDKLAGYKQIKQFEFKKELPVSLAGKVLKRELREGSK
ncbi:MAG: AMP-binding protein, partial [Candidatus Helarchaeota archaeon]|nr:AMP-binding protein [Candidatus Helarchaeota archaeon]